MTIPYIPGWGDALREGLPQIAEATKRIINPNYDREQALVAEITKDPSLLPKLAEIETNSPGSLEKIYGKGVRKLMASMHLSPTQELAQKRVAGAAATQAANPEIVAEHDLGIDPAQREINRQKVTAGNMDLAVKKKIFDAIESNPDVEDLVVDATYKVFGSTPEEITAGKQRRLGVAISKQVSAKDILSKSISGETIDIEIGGKKQTIQASEALQAIFTSHDKSTEALFKNMMQEADITGRVRISQEAHRQNRDDLVNIEYSQYIKDAVKTGVKAAAMLVFAHGGDRSVLTTLRNAGVTPESISDEDINKAEEYYAGQQGINRYKADAGLISRIDALGKAKGRADIQAQAMLAQSYIDGRYPGSDIKVELDGTITQGGESLDPRGFLAKLRGEKAPATPTLNNKPSNIVERLISDVKQGTATIDELKASATFKALSEKEQAAIINGIGQQGSIK